MRHKELILYWNINWPQWSRERAMQATKVSSSDLCRPSNAVCTFQWDIAHEAPFISYFVVLCFFFSPMLTTSFYTMEQKDDEPSAWLLSEFLVGGERKADTRMWFPRLYPRIAKCVPVDQHLICFWWFLICELPLMSTMQRSPRVAAFLIWTDSEICSVKNEFKPPQPSSGLTPGKFSKAILRFYVNM